VKKTVQETPKEYTARMLGLAGDRNPLTVLAATPGRLRRLLARQSAAAVGRRPAPGRWSVRQIVAHLADAEVVHAYRIRMMLGRSGGEIQAFNQDAWAVEGRYQDVDLAVALEAFAALRALNLTLYRRLGPEKRRRFGVHQERGRESIDHTSRMYAGHDLNHLGQISAILGKPL
jgi:DinB family protein